MAWWDEDSDTDTKYAAPAQGPLTQQQAAAAQTWAGVAANLANKLYGTTQPAATTTTTTTTSSKPKPKPATSAPVQGPATQAQAAQAATWEGVINRLRPALNLPAAAPKPAVTTQVVQEADAAVAAFNALGQQRPRPNVTQLNQPVQPRPDLAELNQSVAAFNTLNQQKPILGPQQKPPEEKRYTWDDQIKDNLGALWGQTAQNIRDDWADVWEAGRGNFFPITQQASEMQKQEQAIRDLNQGILQRAYELRQTYWDKTRDAAMLSGRPIDEAVMNINTLSMQPFIEAAEKELGQPLVAPQGIGPASQIGSVISGIAQNAGQIPGYNAVPGMENVPGANFLSPGSAVNLVGNVVGTAMNTMMAATQTLAQAPTTFPESQSDEFVTTAQALSAFVDAVADPEAWWSNPDRWTWENNPIPMVYQVFRDNEQRVIDTMNQLGPAPGDVLVAGDDERRWNKAIGNVFLATSDQQSKEAYVDAVLNRADHIAELVKQRNAAEAVSHNMALPEDVRQANAIIAAQTQNRITMLQTADAYQLALEHIDPIRDAILQTVLDPTVWYDVASLIKATGFKNFSPQARRLRATQEILARTNTEVAQRVAEVVGQTGQHGRLYGMLWEGGLSQTAMEVKDAKVLFANLFADVSDKTDIPKILQYMVDYPDQFAGGGIPAKLVNSPAIRAMADADGMVRLVRGQMQQKEFQYLFQSLKNVSGQFAQLPTLAVAKANVPEVIEDLLTVVEIQSAVKNKVSPFRRAVPIGTTEAKVTTVANAAGDLMYRTEYLNSEGRVIARYHAPSERVAQMEVKIATQNIKAGRYVDRNFVDMASRFMRNSFSQQVLVTVPGAWVNNAVGALISGFVTGANTMVPGDQIMTLVRNVFPNGVPYEYMLAGDAGQIVNGPGVWGLIPGIKKVMGKMRQIRGGQTELRLPGGRTIKFGENAHKLGNWFKGFQQVTGQALDTHFRTVAEPALLAAQADPKTISVLRNFAEKLAKDGNLSKFYDDVTQYAIGRKPMLDMGALGKTYETLVADRHLWTKIEQIVDASNADPATFKTLWERMIDEEIAKVANTAGYDSTVVTVPHSVQGDIAEMLQETTMSVESMARKGIVVGQDARTIEEGIAATQDHLRRVWSLAVQARTPEAMAQFKDYYDTLRMLRRNIQEELNRLRLHAKTLNTDEAWLSYDQAKLRYYREYGERALQTSEQIMHRVLGGAEVIQPPTITPTQIAQAAAAQVELPDFTALQRQFDDEIAQQVTPLTERLRQIAQELQQVQAAAPPIRIDADSISQAWADIAGEFKLPTLDDIAKRVEQGKNALTAKQLEKIAGQFVGGLEMTGHEAVNRLVREWQQLGSAASDLPSRVAQVLNQQSLNARFKLSDLQRLGNFTEEEWPQVQRYLRDQQLEGRLTLMPLDDPGSISAADRKWAIDMGAGHQGQPDTRMIIYPTQKLPVTEAAPAAPPLPRIDTTALEAEAQQLMEQVARLQPEIENRFLESMRQANEQAQLYLQQLADAEQAAPSVPAAAPVVAADPLDVPANRIALYRDGKWIYPESHFNEAVEFFRRAEEVYTDTFAAAAYQAGDIRAMDVFLQVRSDIERMKGEFWSQVNVMQAEMEAAVAQFGPRTPQRRAAYDRFYGFKAGGAYDLAVATNAKLKAATAYLQNMPEPITFRHSQYGEVTVVGHRTNGVAIRLPSGAITTVAEDAIPLPTLQMFDQRMAALKNVVKNPTASVTVPGVPEVFDKQVNKAAKAFYDDLLTSRQNMYSATPTVSDAMGDQILLLQDLKQQGDVLGKQLNDLRPRTLTPKQASAMVDYANDVRKQWRQWTEAASDYGNKLASFAMIEFGRTYRTDQVMSLFFPFHTWTTRTGKNLIERIATQPLFRHAMDINSALFEHLNGDAEKEYVTVYINGQPQRIYIGMGKYMLSVSQYTNDPTYYEQRAMGGPLGPVFAVEAATGAGAYPWVDSADNFIRKYYGMEDTNTSLWNTNPWTRLGWNVANAVGGSFIAENLPFAFTDDSIRKVTTTMQSKVAMGEMTQMQATLAGAALENWLYGTPFDPKLTPDQVKDAKALMSSVIQETFGRETVSSVTGMLTGTTVVPEAPGLRQVREQQEQYFAAQYPENNAGGVTAQRALREQYPALETGWLRYSLEGDYRKQEEPEPLGTQARRMELQQKKDAIYDQMNDAVTAYIISKSGTVASYKGVNDVKQPFWDQIKALEKEYDLPELAYGPRDLTRMNPFERAVYELEQVLRYDGQKPDRPADDASPEEQVRAWEAINDWERARLDYIERTIEAVNVSYEGPGDPPADLWVKELQKLTTDEYASELVRKYDDIKYADRVERQWSPYGTFERELDNLSFREREENIRQRLGDQAVHVFQVYQRVKPENKEQYREEHPEVTVAITAAYNPNEYDQAIQLFGPDAWTKYKAYKNAKPAFPEGGSDEAVQAYYKKLADVQKKYPGIVELEFWVDGRHRWWYGNSEEQYRTTEPGPREGAMGADYQLAKQLFGPDIFQIVNAFPSGGTKKQIAQFYDKYPQYAAYSAWRKQYNNLEEMTLADLPQLNLAALPSQEQIPASMSPWWSKFATMGDVSRPLGSGRETINETPAQAQARVAANAEFAKEMQAEKAKAAAIKEQGRAAVIDSNSYEDDDEFNRRYGRRGGYSRRYYGGRRRGGGGGGRRRGGGGGGGGGYGFEVPGLNPALWQQAERQVTPLMPVGSDIQGNLWGSLLEKLRRPGR